MKTQLKVRWGIVAIIVVLVALSRLLPHAVTTGFFNFSPLGSIALFGAAYFSNRYLAFIVPTLALWASNLLLDNIFFSQYYDGFAWFANLEVYLAFLLIALMGTFLFKKITLPRLAVGAMSSSLIFFVVTNFYVWLKSGMYATNLEGLATCFVAAIPFYWNTLASDVFFVALLFGGFEWVKRQYPALVLEKA